MTVEIALVGSGPSGLYALQHLLESGLTGAVTVFESGAQAGSGTPYDAAYNDPAMLANIASVELPPVGETLLCWARRQSPERKGALGINDSALDERTFLPRIALGAYFADGLKTLLSMAPARGWTVDVRTRCLVVDVAAHRNSATVKFADPAGQLHLEDFTSVIIATGHFAKAHDGHTWQTIGEDEPLYRQVEAGAWSGKRVGVIGTSLSAIDVAVGIAMEAGSFAEVAGRVTYKPLDLAAPPSITLMSRRGVLPEADFYCPIPYAPLQVLTPAAIAGVLRKPRRGRLDRLFDLFRDEVTLADPDYAVSIDLDKLDADTFPSAYFAARMTNDTMEWARRDLAETLVNAEAKRTVPWKYAILRMHEPLGEAARHLDPVDRERFDTGLAQVFIDNYAAAPPLSIKRLLALSDCGALTVVRLGPAYVRTQGEDGCHHFTTSDGCLAFDHVLDARGQSPLTAQELPLPTLRLQIMANAVRSGSSQSESDKPIEIGDSLSLNDGINRLSQVYCLSIPHLLRRHPFSQGLTSCHELSGKIVKDIKASAVARPATEDDRAVIGDLIDELDRTSLIDCMTLGTVVQVPA